ncbi:MAG TPA: hypothetical protein VIR62_08110 [Allosphingosinicella sp.]
MTVVTGVTLRLAALTTLVRLTLFTLFTRSGRSERLTAPAFASLTSTGLAGGFAATLIAPTPMIAPPQVQAPSFAKAIFIDMIPTLFLAFAAPGKLTPNTRHRSKLQEQ